MALKLRADVLSMPDPTPLSIFDDAYAADHPLIDEGRREMMELGIGGAS